MKKTDYVKDKNTGVVFLAKNVELNDDYVYISEEEYDSYVDPHYKEN